MSKLKSITIEEDDKIMVINPRPATTIEYTQEYEEELPDKYNREYRPEWYLGMGYRWRS